MFGKNRVEGFGVRVRRRKNSVKPNRSNVGRDEVVRIGVLDVVMGLGEKAFESGKLSEGISRFETRGPEQAEVGHEGRVVEGREWKLEGEAGGRDGEELKANGHVRVKLLLA